MQTDHLPDCPCCGGDAEYVETMYGAGMLLSASIRCRDCDLHIEHRGVAGKIADTRAKVIAAWSCRVPKNKLCLIVSQYYYSRYCFLAVYNPDTFRAQAMACVAALEDYKRPQGDPRSINYGDLSDEWYRKGARRYNVNDSGDIYFVMGDSVDELLPEIRDYYQSAERERHLDRRKGTAKKIALHHQASVVYGIVKSIFNLI